MIWDALLGQQAAVAGLRAALRSGRAAHGYLFEGPPGVGKRTAAMLLAQALLCHRPPAPDDACGDCPSCRWLAERDGVNAPHPDLIPLLKNPGDRASEKLLGDQEAVIPIETMQHVATQLHRAPSHGPRRIVVIPEAQRACRGQAEAANSFLKTLEEPPRASAVILTSSQPEALLETVISRVQSVRLHRLPAEAIRAGLRARAGRRTEAEIDLAAAMSDGSLGRALELLEGDLGRWRQAVLGQLAALDARCCPRLGLELWTLADAEGDRLYESSAGAGGASSAAEDVSAEDEAEEGGGEESRKSKAGWKRYVFQRLLELYEAALRDALLTAAGAAPEQLVLLRGDATPLAARLARQFGASGCERLLETLAEARRANRLYVRGDLIGRVLAGRLVEAQEHQARR